MHPREVIGVVTTVAGGARAAGNTRTATPVMRPAAPAAVAAALADLSGVNAYFDIQLGPPPAARRPAGGERAEGGPPPADGRPVWRPFGELATDRRALAGAIDRLAERLDAGQRRVAASTIFLGLAARLWGPAIGAAGHGVLLDLDPWSMLWPQVADPPAGPLPLRLPEPAGWEAGDARTAAEVLYRTVVDGLLEPLAAAVGREVAVSPRVLWGNAASGLAGTMRTLLARRPATAGRGLEIGRLLLARGRLAGTGRLSEPRPGYAFFVRRSCCLYYRVPGAGTCLDCVLVDGDDRQARWNEALAQNREAP